MTAKTCKILLKAQRPQFACPIFHVFLFVLVSTLIQLQNVLEDSLIYFLVAAPPVKVFASKRLRGQGKLESSNILNGTQDFQSSLDSWLAEAVLQTGVM